MANIRFIFFVMGIAWTLDGYADTAKYPNIVFENTQIVDLRSRLIEAFKITKFNGYYKLYVNLDGCNELLISLRENKQDGAQGQVGVFIQGVEGSEASEGLTHCKKYLIESIQSLKFRHVSSNAVDAKFKRNTLFATTGSPRPTDNSRPGRGH